MPVVDGLLVALLVALFGQLVPAGLTFHAIFTLLVVRAFVVDVRWTLVMLVGVTLAIVIFSQVHGLSDDLTVPEFFEWLVLISLVGLVAILAGRREKAARHFASLYHEATEQLVTSQEEQRRRFAQDLHDGVGQGIGALLLRLDAVAGRVAADPQTAAIVESARELASRVLDDVRGVALRLHPAIAHPAGLAGALRALAEHAGIPVDLALDPRVQPGVLSAAAETALFRIVQEALANAARHSMASRVQVTVELMGSEVHAAVADDGVGFALARAGGRGIGLLGMHERAARAGGRLVVKTEPGRGTIVAATLPCIQPEVAAAGAARAGPEAAVAGSEP